MRKKQIIRLRESDLHKMIRESVKQVLQETTTSSKQRRQLREYTTMQGSVDNGFNFPPEAEQYLAKRNTFFGNIAKLAQQNNMQYLEVLKNLQNKLKGYIDKKYFGTNPEVIDTVNKFVDLLAYMHGIYESAISRMMNSKAYRMRTEANIYSPIRTNPLLRQQNQYGLNQLADGKGSWMTDLQNELKQFLAWNFLHGPKTVEATNALIAFLEVEKQELMYAPQPQPQQGGNTPQPSPQPIQEPSPKAKGWLKKVAFALAGIGMLAGMCGIGMNFNNGGQNQMMNNQAPTQQQQVVQTPSQGVQVSFQINQNQLSPQDAQQLQSIPQGNYKIVIHNTQNSSGKDASYEGQLAQSRGQQIAKFLKGSNVQIERGTNVMGNAAYAEIIPM